MRVAWQFGSIVRRRPGTCSPRGTASNRAFTLPAGWRRRTLAFPVRGGRLPEPAAGKVAYAYGCESLSTAHTSVMWLAWQGFCTMPRLHRARPYAGGQSKPAAGTFKRSATDPQTRVPGVAGAATAANVGPEARLRLCLHGNLIIP